MKILCLLRGETFAATFKVVVNADDDDILDLKKRIKEERRSPLGGVDVSDIVLFKVSIPLDNEVQLADAYRAIDSGENQALSVGGTIPEVIPSQNPKHIGLIISYHSKLPQLLTSCRPLAPYYRY